MSKSVHQITTLCIHSQSPTSEHCLLQGQSLLTQEPLGEYTSFSNYVRRTLLIMQSSYKVCFLLGEQNRIGASSDSISRRKGKRKITYFWLQIQLCVGKIL